MRDNVLHKQVAGDIGLSPAQLSYVLTGSRTQQTRLDEIERRVDELLSQ